MRRVIETSLLNRVSEAICEACANPRYPDEWLVVGRSSRT